MVAKSQPRGMDGSLLSFTPSNILCLGSSRYARNAISAFEYGPKLQLSVRHSNWRLKPLGARPGFCTLKGLCPAISPSFPNFCGKNLRSTEGRQDDGTLPPVPLLPWRIEFISFSKEIHDESFWCFSFELWTVAWLTDIVTMKYCKELRGWQHKLFKEQWCFCKSMATEKQAPAGRNIDPRSQGCSLNWILCIKKITR